ncbi:tRNA splicing endonuclease subunit 2 [Leptinotarsa decemlineata]|uniref:tRNA splicing endonuclease subunit 2 n=1 Tax=Leptinotarsa decemlineata TaxID=7539 RepID=UPI000C251C15|nr:tRNA-splicing endonuclease subunit Sen2 [Leptinotarsa decemlineata]XP_023026160.1 tRNA-splicing endonuclease subunit Sen2 [Leptinotarsa decemlineata]XP_023026167.1 tRNA-splicing endonuclease subunit Sen2 [Leptinotarsa decemlineata]XP_023026174.1 tRNA-splicing endonuclease subunit Sen2 [Leptinotarsa decemlineata]
MELTEPRPKKCCKLSKNLPLPVILKKDGTVHRINGFFNGFSVCITDKEDMKKIISMGYFGKANLSRNYPQFGDKRTEILRNRQYKKRKAWSEQTSSKDIRKIIVVPDSEDDNEDYFTNLRPEYQIDRSGLKETVWLSLEESFFLSETVKCLNIFNGKNILSSEECWKLFSEADPHFKQNYIVYFHFRAKNWVVKPGIKFGGDYLLYKQGPPFFHASYVVIIDFMNEDSTRNESMLRKSLDNVSLLSLNRLCETAGKELMICQVTGQQNEDIHYTNLGSFVVNELLVKRWMLTQELS